MGKISKYHDLFVFLDGKIDDTVQLSFEKIEFLISSKLPQSAYQYQAWWANGENSHAHANTWQDAGYKVDEVHFGDYVVFRRIKTNNSSS